MKINRLLQIIILLINKKDITVRYLAEQFNVSKKTIYRDLETLITSGIPVCYGENQKGTVYLVEGYSLKYAFLPTGEGKRMVFDAEALGMSKTIDIKNMMNDYSEVWKAFINHRNINTSQIRREILQSWVRCQGQKVRLYDIDIESLVKPDEFKDYVVEYLDECKEEGFETFNIIVKNLDLDISIYDAHAKLKYIFNVNYLYEDLYPKKGHIKNASENEVGTNATSLALIENKPCMVFGPEHYNNEFHKYCSVAAPIYNKSTIIGTVNACFVHTSITADTLNIIYSLARLYELLIVHREKTYTNKDLHEHFVRSNKSQNNDIETLDNIWGVSKKWQVVKDIAKSMSMLDCAMVISGEKGIGKKTLARCIHNESKRKSAPCIIFDCKAFKADALERIMFGCESSSYNNEEKGIIENATGGTLILQNIEYLSTDAQKQLYNFLINGKIRRVGSKKFFNFDVRIIVCYQTNIDVLIYEPLWNYLNIVQIAIPPLRERKEDIRNLIDKKMTLSIDHKTIKKKDIYYLMGYLESYPWKRNITELFDTYKSLIDLASTSKEKNLKQLLFQIMNDK
ncbi:sigma 54-interacting transcriptional regulator [Clostridiaceae bacterium M8S5]|nr:sigma 54-interacting transcriptional regulator [Clostridiaceae bacterium M8S5]